MKPELIKFVAGTKAKASEVNENFEKVLNYAETASAIVSFDIDTEYNFGQWVLGQVDDKFGLYESLVEENKGHLLSDENYWKKVSMGGGLITGQIILSLDPLYDDGLHLADGALLLAGGVYDKFVTEYIPNLYTTNPERFTTEENWQASVTSYGVCDKYVYTESVSVRLPKVGKCLYSDIKNTAPSRGNGMTLGLTNGTNNFGLCSDGTPYVQTYSHLYGTNAGSSATNPSTMNNRLALGVTTDPTKSGVITDLTNVTNPLECYYYIVVATTSKTDIEVDLDNIATDLNGKADVDLTNVSDEGKALMSKMAMPSGRAIDLTLGASGSTYIAPANGWFYLNKVAGSDWYYCEFTGAIEGLWDSLPCWGSGYRTSPIKICAQVKKGATIKVNYNATGVTNNFKFIYAEGEV